jgi:hypothetical protein
MTAASLEQIAVDATFAVWGKAAIYAPPGGEAPISCIAIRHIGDRRITGLSGRPVMSGAIIEVRRSEVAAPAKGGIFTFIENGAAFQVVSDPEAADPERLVWACSAQSMSP